jgi:hypothetical protein
MPEALDLAQPARQWVPTRENLGHPGIWVALDFIESLGDAGLCSIEARGHDATRAIYDTILGKA